MKAKIIGIVICSILMIGILSLLICNWTGAFADVINETTYPPSNGFDDSLLTTRCTILENALIKSHNEYCDLFDELSIYTYKQSNEIDFTILAKGTTTSDYVQLDYTASYGNTPEAEAQGTIYSAFASEIGEGEEKEIGITITIESQTSLDLITPIASNYIYVNEIQYYLINGDAIAIQLQLRDYLDSIPGGTVNFEIIIAIDDLSDQQSVIDADTMFLLNGSLEYYNLQSYPTIKFTENASNAEAYKTAIEYFLEGYDNGYDEGYINGTKDQQLSNSNLYSFNVVKFYNTSLLPTGRVSLQITPGDITLVVYGKRGTSQEITVQNIKINTYVQWTGKDINNSTSYPSFVYQEIKDDNGNRYWLYYDRISNQLTGVVQYVLKMRELNGIGSDGVNTLISNAYIIANNETTNRRIEMLVADNGTNPETMAFFIEKVLNNGYDSGYADGVLTAQQLQYDLGYSRGKQDGLQAQISELPALDATKTIVRAALDVFNIKLFGLVTILDLIGLVTILGLITFILKLARG